MIPKSISKPGASLSPVCVDTAGVHVRLMAALLAQLSEYLALTKPRVMSLVVFTAMVGLVASPGHVEPAVGLATILCIALGAGAAGTLNMWYDADVDAVMSRTAARPIPRGRISARSALAFGMPSGALSVVVLETWLVVTGVILWGAFPVVYATLVSAFYVPVIIMLLGLILRGVSFEFRNQHPGTRWIWDSCFILGSLAVSFMQGVMVGLLLEDLKFIDGKYSGGLFGSFNDFSVLCGVSYTTTTIGLSKWSR